MKKNDLNFIVKGIVKDPNEQKGMCSDIPFNITATFSYLDDSDNFAYGNKTYLGLRGTFGLNPHYSELFDCRYDKRLKTGHEIEYITQLLQDRYTGKDGAYIIKSLSIEKAD